MGALIRRVLWRGVEPPGAERCELRRSPSGWRIAGTAIAAIAGSPALARYAVALASDWSTRDVLVELWLGAGDEAQRLRLAVDDRRRWTIARDPAGRPDDPAAAAALRGLADVDLGVTPATNTLPIRRLALAVGASVEVTAAWVRFPGLTVEPLPQRYTRLGERRYRYESAGGAFAAEIVVDDLGLVVDYAGGWERIAQASPRR